MILMMYNDHAMILLFLDTSLFLKTLLNLYDINKNTKIDNKKIWFIFIGLHSLVNLLFISILTKISNKSPGT